MGACMEAAQTAEGDAPSSQHSKDQPSPLRCVFSADGAMVPLVKKQWAETRTVAIGEPQEKRTASGETEIHVGQFSYFSRLAACRREQSSSPPSCSPREHILHGTGRVDLLLFHRRQKRGGNGGHMTWKEASVPVLRPG